MFLWPVRNRRKFARLVSLATMRGCGATSAVSTAQAVSRMTVKAELDNVSIFDEEYVPFYETIEA